MIYALVRLSFRFKKTLINANLMMFKANDNQKDGKTVVSGIH